MSHPPLDWSKYPNFQPHEFACSCPCQQVEMDPHFLEWLQRLRSFLDFPFPVTSGYRCPDHNEAVSSSNSRTGPHTTGKAADLALHHEQARQLVLTALSRLAQGVGIKQHGPLKGRFVHLDLDPRRRALWTYR